MFSPIGTFFFIILIYYVYVPILQIFSSNYDSHTP